MVYGRYIYSIHGVYKPTNTTGGHHPAGFCEDLSAVVTVIFDTCPVHKMATWIHHLQTKVQQMKLMRSSFRCCAWLEKEWHSKSVALCLGLTYAGWCQRSFHARQAQRSSCIIWMERWRWIKTWESKGLLDKPLRCPALTYQQICIQHGVMSVSSPILKESLPWKVLHILKEQRMENIYIISPAALQV